MCVKRRAYELGYSEATFAVWWLLMRGLVPPDPLPGVGVSEVRYAVVSVPRRSRNRFAASCVTIKASAEAAVADADTEKKFYPARVLGPSKSSEGVIIFYLVEWLF